MKFERGIVSIPMILGLVLMAIAIPVAGQLALKNQDNRNRAAGSHPPNCSCNNGVFVNDGGPCVALGYNCGLPSTTQSQCTSDSSCTGGQKCVSGKCALPSTTSSGCTCSGANGAAGVFGGVNCPASMKGRQCGGSIQKGSSCSANEDCSSRNCAGPTGSKKCADPKVVNGTKCKDNSECLSGACKGLPGFEKCTPTNTQNGSACGNDNECSSGNCKGVPGFKKCEAKLPIGSECSGNIDCGSGRCRIDASTKSLRCYPLDPIGSGCKLDGDCASGACIGTYPNRKCAPSENYRPLGSDCILSSVCASGNCSGGKCVFKPCNCPSGQACADGVCFVPGSSITPGKKTGSTCAKSSECATNMCVGGKCISRPVVPAPCSITGCNSGYNCINDTCTKATFPKPIVSISPVKPVKQLCGNIICKEGFKCSNNSRCVKVY